MAEVKKKASAKIVDMSKVTEGGAYQTKRVPEGDYLARVTKVVDGKSKNDGGFQWVFTIVLDKKPTGTYPYYCKLQENQLWKVRNLLVAAGINVPKKKLKLDPEKVVGKLIAVTMEDDEYEGKMKSVVAAIFPPSEMGESTDAADDVDDDTDDDSSDEETATWADLVALDRAGLKQFCVNNELDVKFLKSVDDDGMRQVVATAAGIDPSDDDDDEEEPTPKKKDKKKGKGKKGKKSSEVTDDDLEELNIDDV